MPIRNGARYIATAIRALQAQSHCNWHLSISDNASTDETPAICRKLAADDKRISIISQKNDLGAPANFQFVLSQARDEYFMWAAADDVWHPQFISACVAALDRAPEIGLAFTGVENIDSNGQPLRRYEHLAELAGPASYRTVLRFLLQPEMFGKANLIYGVYRTSLCRDVMMNVGFPDCWGSDMVFVLGALTRAGLYIEPKVLFQKRIDSTRESLSMRTGQRRLVPGDGLFPLAAYPSYRTALLLAARGSKFEAMTRIAMGYRYAHALISDWLDKVETRVRTRFG